MKAFYVLLPREPSQGKISRHHHLHEWVLFFHPVKLDPCAPEEPAFSP